MPVFDVSGVYEGTWEGTSTDDQEAEACGVTMELTHNPGANYPASHTIQGVLTIDYSCIDLPEAIDPVEASVVNVTFILRDNGTLATITGGCGPGLCVLMGLDGQGVDTDGDGFMDQYSGDWAYTILLAGVQPFGVEGTFEVEVTSAE